MHLLSKSIIIASIVCFFGCLPKKHQDADTSSTFVNPVASEVDTVFNRLWHEHLSQKLDFNQCPGMAIAIIKGNEVIFEEQFGTKGRYDSAPIDSSTLFRIGSVSKGFAGVLTGLLVSQGKVSLEDPVSKYIPELTLKAKSKDKILRVKHIMSHSTGLTEHAFSNLVDENRSMETIIGQLNRLTPRDSTGKRYAYQNAAFGLIERVVQAATGMSYSQALETYIFQPLKMNGSSATFEEMTLANNVCKGHKYGRNGFVQIPCSPHYYNVASAGGVNSNLVDMKKWLRAVMGQGEGVDHKAFDIAFTPQVNTSHDDKYFNHWTGFVQSHYGLGWRLIKTTFGDYVYHGGLVNGFRSEIAYDRSKNIGIVVMFNSTCAYSNYVVPEFFEMWHTYHLPKVASEHI
jgi:beta-lactamase class C